MNAAGRQRTRRRLPTRGHPEGSLTSPRRRRSELRLPATSRLRCRVDTCGPTGGSADHLLPVQVRDGTTVVRTVNERLACCDQHGRDGVDQRDGVQLQGSRVNAVGVWSSLGGFQHRDASGTPRRRHRRGRRHRSPRQASPGGAITASATWTAPASGGSRDHRVPGQGAADERRRSGAATITAPVQTATSITMTLRGRGTTGSPCRRSTRSAPARSRRGPTWWCAR